MGVIIRYIYRREKEMGGAEEWGVSSKGRKDVGGGEKKRDVVRRV